MFRRLIAAGLAIAALGAAIGAASAQTLDKIKQRGALVVGTKADYKPYGFRDPNGAIVGFEPDLAKDVADRLKGKLDLMLATMNVTDERRKIVGIVDPSYYASGVNVFAVKKAALKNWDQLKGQKICGIQGAWYNKEVAEKYGAEIVAFKGQTEAENALLQGNCIGWLYDDTAFIERLSEPKWAAFEMPLETILVSPWG